MVMPEKLEMPLPMLLTCPMCGERHIDEGEFETKPHHTHACQSCGMVWRPALVATVGVRFLPGFKNAPVKPAPGDGTSAWGRDEIRVSTTFKGSPETPQTKMVDGALHVTEPHSMGAPISVGKTPASYSDNSDCPECAHPWSEHRSSEATPTRCIRHVNGQGACCGCMRVVPALLRFDLTEASKKAPAPSVPGAMSSGMPDDAVVKPLDGTMRRFCWAYRTLGATWFTCTDAENEKINRRIDGKEPY